MSEEPNNIPAGETDMTPEQASQQIDEVLAAVAKDPTHPYADAHHFQHTKEVAKMARLFEIKTKDGSLMPLEKKFAEVLEQVKTAKAERQSALFAEATTEAELLENLGFAPTDIPEDVKEWQLDALRMQRLSAERKFEELAPILGKQLKQLKVSAEIQGLFSTFNLVSDMDEQLKRNIADQIVNWVYRANEQKAKQPKHF